MKMLSFLTLTALACAVLPLNSAEAGRRGCDCCGTVYVAPAAASPAAATTDAAPAVAQNNSGYRSFSYQPAAAAPAMNYNSGYSRTRRSNQPMWMNGGNKSLGRYN